MPVREGLITTAEVTALIAFVLLVVGFNPKIGGQMGEFFYELWRWIRDQSTFQQVCIFIGVLVGLVSIVAFWLGCITNY